LKIVVCTSEYPPYASGIGNVAYRMVKEFEKSGHTCTVCSPTGPDIKLGSYRLIRRSGGLGLLHFWWQVSRHFAGKSARWDSVWLHWPMFLGRIPFPNAVVTYHGTYRGFRDMAREMGSSLFVKAYYGFMELAERRYLRRLGGSGCEFTVVSPRTAAELRSQGVQRDSIFYIPVGVDTEQFHPVSNKWELRREQGIPPEALVFLYVGRLTRPKNLFQLLDAFGEVKGRLEQAVLLVVGGGELGERLSRYPTEKKVPDVRLLGHIPNDSLPRIFGCADFFVMASTYEGQPVALLEAMAVGLPPIVSGIPVMRQVVDESGAGLVVDFDNPGEAAQQISDYVLGAKAEEDREAASQYVGENMSSKLCAQKYLQVLERAALGRSMKASV